MNSSYIPFYVENHKSINSLDGCFNSFYSSIPKVNE